jgi:hypothetical protein
VLLVSIGSATGEQEAANQSEDGSRADGRGNRAATEEIDGAETENRIGIKHELRVRERDKTLL